MRTCTGLATHRVGSENREYIHYTFIIYIYKVDILFHFIKPAASSYLFSCPAVPTQDIEDYERK